MNKYKEAVKTCKKVAEDVRNHPNANPTQLYDWAISLAANKVLISELSSDLWEESQLKMEEAKNKENDIYLETRAGDSSIKDAEIEAKELTKDARKKAIKLQAKSRKFNAYIKSINDVISTIQTKISYLKSERIESSLPEDRSK